MTRDLAPIAVFAYRRKDYLARTLDALEACPEFSRSPVTIYCDGPKPDSAADVAAVRAMLAARRRSNMTIVEAPSNRGLATSIMAGVTQQCARHGRVIIVEDDLILSPVALTWFNQALDAYSEDARVWQVGGHQFPVPEFAQRCDGMFLDFCTSWGWATWKRAWDQFDPAAAGWQALQNDDAMRHSFSLNGAYPYAAMMEQQMDGRLDSWAIRWWWSMFRGRGLGLHPPRSLVSNIGGNRSATHAPSLLRQLLTPRQAEAVDIRIPGLPPNVAVDQQAQKALETFLRTHTNPPLWKAVLQRVGF